MITSGSVPESSIVYGLAYRVVKRAMDITITALGLVILFPLLLLIGILIKLTSPGPIFYAWDVIGRSGRPFRSYKFRSMVQNADKLKAKLMYQNEMEGPVFKMKNDPRITRVGRVIRKYSIDELPQLWSVLKGDMSLVGPRPAGPHEWVKYEDWQRCKLSVQPGITCLWQVNGRNQIHSFSHWIALDLEYIDNWSLWLDIKILLKTVGVVVRGTGH